VESVTTSDVAIWLVITRALAVEPQKAFLEAVSFRVQRGWGLKVPPKDTLVVDGSVVQVLALFHGQRVVGLVYLGAFSSAG
jgi:hypothetical protein